MYTSKPALAPLFLEIIDAIDNPPLLSNGENAGVELKPIEDVDHPTPHSLQELEVLPPHVSKSNYLVVLLRQNLSAVVAFTAAGNATE